MYPSSLLTLPLYNGGIGTASSGLQVHKLFSYGVPIRISAQTESTR